MSKMLFITGALMAVSVSGPAFAQTTTILSDEQLGLEFFGGAQNWQSRADVDQAHQQLGQHAQALGQGLADAPDGAKGGKGAQGGGQGQTALWSGMQNPMQGGGLQGGGLQGGLQSPMPLQAPMQGVLQTPTGLLGGLIQGVGGTP